MWRSLAGTCSTLAHGFYGSTFCLNGYDRTFYHAEESLLNSFSTYVASAIRTTTAPSRNLINFIDVDDAHAVTTLTIRSQLGDTIKDIPRAIRIVISCL